MRRAHVCPVELLQKPIHMRLSDTERTELEAIAAKESRSISSMARLVYLRGIESIQAE